MKLEFILLERNMTSTLINTEELVNITGEKSFGVFGMQITENVVLSGKEKQNANFLMRQEK